MNPGSVGNGNIPCFLTEAIVFVEHVLHFDRCFYRPCCFKFVIVFREVEHRHDRVSHIFVDDAFVVCNRLVHMFEVGIQKIQNFLGFHRFRKGREGTDITKKHRHMITFRSS